MGAAQRRNGDHAGVANDRGPVVAVLDIEIRADHADHRVRRVDFELSVGLRDLHHLAAQPAGLISREVCCDAASCCSTRNSLLEPTLRMDPSSRPARTRPRGGGLEQVVPVELVFGLGGLFVFRGGRNQSVDLARALSRRAARNGGQ